MFHERTITVVDLSNERCETDVDALNAKIEGLYEYNKALITEIKLLRKCLDEAIEDRDRYRDELQEDKVRIITAGRGLHF